MLNELVGIGAGVFALGAFTYGSKIAVGSITDGVNGIVSNITDKIEAKNAKKKSNNEETDMNEEE